MGELANRIQAMRVRVSTPDELVHIELYDRDRVTTTFRPRVYEQSTASDLEQRLSVLAKLLWAARTREFQRIYEDVTGDYSRGEVPMVSERDRAWLTDRDTLQARGSSTGGHVTVRATGLRAWQIHVDPDYKRHLDETQFAEAVNEAAGAFIRDQYMKVAELSNRYYGDEAWVGGTDED